MFPGSLGLSLLGSVPLSLSSEAVTGSPLESVIGSPFSSTASPVPETVLVSLPVALEGSTVTVNSITNESPIASAFEADWSTKSTTPVPSQAAFSETLLPVSLGAVTIVSP